MKLQKHRKQIYLEEELFMRKTGKVTALALCAAMALAGCGGKTAEAPQPAAETKTETTAAKTEAAKTEEPAETEAPAGEKELEGKLVFWSMWNDTEPQGEVFQSIIDDFTELHPKVDIEVQWCGRDIKKILKPALDGGEEIDVFDYPLENELGDYCLDLTEYVNKPYATTDGKALKDTILPSMLVTPKMQTKISDKLPAIGYKPFMCLFMYNKAIFDEVGVTAPTTWEELDAICAKIKEAGYSPITFDDAYSTWLPGMYLAREKGEDFVRELVNDKTGEMWKDEAVVNMAKAFEDFAKKGYFDSNVGGNKWPAGQVDVGNGKVAMYYNLTGLPTEVADITGPDFKWGAFGYPDLKAGDGKSGKEEVSGSGMITIGKASKNPDLAMEFIAYILSKESDQKMVDHAKMIPTVIGTEWPEAIEAVRPVFESTERVLSVAGDIGANADLTPSIAENFVKLAAGQITAEQFVENMAAVAKQ